MKEDSGHSPQENGCYGAVRARAGLTEARAEEGSDGPCPECSRPGLSRGNRGGAIRHLDYRLVGCFHRGPRELQDPTQAS